MPFNILTFVLDKVTATRQGVSDQRSTELALAGAILPLGPIPSLVITQVIAQNEAASVTSPAPPTTPPSTTPPPVQVQVPNVTGASFAAGQTLLQAFGLQARRQNVLSNTVAKDIVISQSPEAGTTVPFNATVILNVSLGVVVPDVTNQPFPSAQSQLQSLGLQVQRTDQRSATVPRETVISQDPVAGSTLSAGSTVTLAVSTGSSATVPDVTGILATDAQAQLQSAGLQAKLTTQPSGAINKGFVISQDPAAGTDVLFGTVVTLAVSTGQDFQVPDVTGLLFEDASRKLVDIKLQVNRVDQTSDAVIAGHVIRQDPAAGTQVSPNSQVTLFVSTGVATVDLPDLRGKLFADAREILQDLDFLVKRADVYSDQPKDTVIDQDPKPGKVAPETMVTLTVSLGIEQVPKPGAKRS